MGRSSRYVLSFVLAVVIFIGVLHFMKIPRDRLLPPPKLYDDCTATAIGWVTGSREEGTQNHILEGTDTFYYELYKFAPRPPEEAGVKPSKAEPSTPVTWVNGAVRVTGQSFQSISAGQQIKVLYDPYNPNINGVPGTLGVWSRTTGLFNPYLWWYVGLIVLTLVLQEAIRMITRSNE